MYLSSRYKACVCPPFFNPFQYSRYSEPGTLDCLQEAYIHIFNLEIPIFLKWISSVLYLDLEKILNAKEEKKKTKIIYSVEGDSHKNAKEHRQILFYRWVNWGSEKLAVDRIMELQEAVWASNPGLQDFKVLGSSF